jgi:hypothetical protein
MKEVRNNMGDSNNIDRATGKQIKPSVLPTPSATAQPEVHPKQVDLESQDKAWLDRLLSGGR